MVFNYINSVPNSISIVVIPNLQEKYGKNENKADLRTFLNKSDFLVSGLISIMIGLAWIIVPTLVHWILPKFVPGISAMRFLILGTYFIAVGLAYLQFIYAIKKHLLLLPFMALSCGAAWLFNWIALREGWGIEGVAIATTLAIYFNFTVIFIYASVHVFTLGEFLKNYFSFMIKFVFMLALLCLLHQFVRLSSPVLTVCLQAFLFVVAYGPFLVQSNQRFDLISIIRNKLFGNKETVV
jgi:O-antigen/teichoic acid export membrane protein